MNVLKRVIYHIGKRSKLVRSKYLKYSHGMWLWGMVRYIRDKPNYTPTSTVSISEDEFNKLMEKVFDKL